MQFVLREGLARAIELLHSTVSGAQPAARWADLLVAPDANRPHLLAPLDEQEVWAAGVTYRRSAEAREEEAHNIGVYDKVYSAERPEIFMKATPQRVVGPHAPVRIRGDSFWNVPEPELTVVFAPDMQVVGYTVGNDMSSRDIEGANPLYLPQAKIYTGSCALGPAITLLPDLDLQPGATIGLRIERAGAAVFVGETSTREMKRTVAELGGYLGRYNAFP
ncbi:MAG: 2-hydroxyhepta-2,4-diene-1,7-dioate isomerase, partial [Chloroflexi bacterium]